LCYLFSFNPTIILLQLFGGISGIFLHNYKKNNMCIGGSGGLCAIEIFYGLKEMNNFTSFFIPFIFIPLWIRLPLYQITILNIGLDFIGDYLKDNIYNYNKISHKSKWWLKNFNTFRHGTNNISCWGHFGGLCVGIMAYGIYRFWK
jgi:hypothetical protein